MKKLLLISVSVLIAGILLREEVLTLNFYDTYYLISYSLIPLVLAILLTFVALIIFLKRLRNQQNA